MASLAVWSVEIKPGKDHVISPVNAIRITNAALGEKLENENARTTLKLTYDSPKFPEGEEEEDEDEVPGMVEKNTFLCSLTPGKIEQCILDVTLTEDVRYVLVNTGENTIHLSGNYIYQDSLDDGPDIDSEDEDDDDDPAVYLDEVSSDVEMDRADLGHFGDDDSDDEDRFEEVNDSKEKPPTLKRPHEGHSTDVSTADGQKLSKKQQKKLNKKLKAENGNAVPTGAESAASSPEKSTADKITKDKKNDDEKKEKGKDKKNKTEMSKLRELPGGLKIRDGTKLGEGPQAKRGDKVKMRFIGKLPDGKVFDSNTSGKPFKFNLGVGEVIKGWDEGIVGMRPGGERELIVPPELAYGKQGKGPIPANATLRFECKLLSIG